MSRYTYTCYQCKAEMKSQNATGLCKECRSYTCKGCSRKFIRRVNSAGDYCGECRADRIRQENRLTI